MNKKLLDETVKYFSTKYPPNFGKSAYVSDGIVNLAEYKKTSTKILWVLKEVNAKDPEKDWSVSDWLNQDNWTKEYPKWKRTYSKLLKTTWAILNKKWDNIPPAERITDIIRKIAYINIKKTAGKAKSKDTEINQYFNEEKDMILKQIEAIAPDIIINASHVESILNKGALNVLDRQYVNPFMIGHQITQHKKRVVLNVYHSNCRISDVQYIGLIKQCFEKLQGYAL